ncbi:hypothetical protein T484DRAFT_1824472 [Baffinella frigidus]|nr:hypothetical protein T484DRAFT_1824471 [Cryptophyta sp. CCMP2293]KAJ1476560.1 hypothetical protein T484DRAFT_1824472 [Cryptophyta sp. CCMP2293]
MTHWLENSGYDHPDIDDAMKLITSKAGEKPPVGFPNASMFLAVALAKGPSNVMKDVCGCYSDASTTATLFLGIVMTYLMEPPSFEDVGRSSYIAFYALGIFSMSGFTIIIVWNLLLSFTMVNHLREADYLIFLVYTLPGIQRTLVWLFFASVASTCFMVLTGTLATAELWISIAGFIIVTVSVVGFALSAQRGIVFGQHARILNDYWFQRRVPAATDPCDMTPLFHDYLGRKRVAHNLATQDPRASSGYVPCAEDPLKIRPLTADSLFSACSSPADSTDEDNEGGSALPKSRAPIVGWAVEKPEDQSSFRVELLHKLMEVLNQGLISAAEFKVLKDNLLKASVKRQSSILRSGVSSTLSNDNTISATSQRPLGEIGFLSEDRFEL